MHQELIKYIKEWSIEISGIGLLKIADIGSYNINGGIRDIFSNVTGFDILYGDGVDIKISPGTIPECHKYIYDIVFCVNSINSCPSIKYFIDEIKDCIKINGDIFICYRVGGGLHSTSINEYGYTWEIICEKKSKDIIDEFKNTFTIKKMLKINVSENRYDQILILKSEK